MTTEEAKYIIIGTEDGWLKYNESDYEEANRLIDKLKQESE